jgi:hypothetical protein
LRMFTAYRFAIGNAAPLVRSARIVRKCRRFAAVLKVHAPVSLARVARKGFLVDRIVRSTPGLGSIYRQ